MVKSRTIIGRIINIAEGYIVAESCVGNLFIPVSNTISAEYLGGKVFLTLLDDFSWNFRLEYWSADERDRHIVYSNKVIQDANKILDS